jgi:hypothetical protein
MNPEKQKDADPLEKELVQMIIKLDSEKEALSKILKHSGPTKAKKIK